MKNILIIVTLLVLGVVVWLGMTKERRPINVGSSLEGSITRDSEMKSMTESSKAEDFQKDNQTKMVAEPDLPIEARVEQYLRKGDITAAVDEITNHGKGILSKGLNLEYSEGINMTEEEQEADRLKGKRTIEDYIRFLKDMKHRAPELLNDYRFTKNLYDFAMTEKPKDQILINDLIEVMQTRHTKEVGADIYCRVAEQKDFASASIDREFERNLKKCPDKSLKDLYLCMYIVGVEEALGEDESKHILQRFKTDKKEIDCI